MTSPVSYTADALSDLDDIYAYIASDNPGRARSYVAEIEAACAKLADIPLRGSLRPELGAGIRALPLWRRIVVLYEADNSNVLIVRIFSRGRDYEAIMRG